MRRWVGALVSAAALAGGCNGSSLSGGGPVGPPSSCGGSGAWSLLPSGTTQALMGVGGSGHDVYASGWSGAMVASHQGGPFLPETSGASVSVLASVWAAPDGRTFTVGWMSEDDTVLVKTSAGWGPQATGDRHVLYSVSGDPSRVLAAGGGGTALGTDNGVVLESNGTGGWTTTLSLPVHLRAIESLGPAEAYAVGEGGTVMHQVGGAWNREPTPTSETLLSVWSDGQDTYAVGGQLAIVHRVAGNWTLEDSGVFPAPDLRGVWGDGRGNLWAVGDQGTILHSTGDGHWGREPSPVASSLGAVWCNADGLYAVGDGGVILSTR